MKRVKFLSIFLSFYIMLSFFDGVKAVSNNDTKVIPENLRKI